MEQLIEAVLAHAKPLRGGAHAADGYGAWATLEEAQRWERLASAARDELAALLGHYLVQCVAGGIAKHRASSVALLPSTTAQAFAPDIDGWPLRVSGSIRSGRQRQFS
jgi:hypothetical protein